MPKVAAELTSTEIKNKAKIAKDRGKSISFPVGGVAGLYAVATPNGGISWTLRAKVGDKRREIGLGGMPSVPLAMARAKAREKREEIANGIDPVRKRQEARQQLIREQQSAMTFRQVAKLTYEVKAPQFRNDKHSAQWYGTLERYAFPTIGHMLISDVRTDDVFRLLEAIWQEKPETATRVRQRMQAVFEYALSGDDPLRSNPTNPAAWHHHKAKLPDPEKLKKRRGIKHHARVPVEDIPRFMRDLATRESTSARALRFSVLTCARSAEVRGATWAEIDLGKRTWRLPAERMKQDKAHTVPLSDAAIEILTSLPHRAGLLFPNSKGKEFSVNALRKMLHDAHDADVQVGGKGYIDPVRKTIATQHGTARSTFKDWSREDGRYPDEWSELALAHVNSDSTRDAYARNEIIEERRTMMEDWGRYCSGVTADNVVDIKQRRAK